MTKFNFLLELPNGTVIGETTVMKKKDGTTTFIDSEKELKTFIKRQFLIENSCKSFQDWCDDLNNSGDYEGEFSVDDAYDSMCNIFNLNINKKYIDLHKFMDDMR